MAPKPKPIPKTALSVPTPRASMPTLKGAWAERQSFDASSVFRDLDHDACSESPIVEDVLHPLAVIPSPSRKRAQRCASEDATRRASMIPNSRTSIPAPEEAPPPPPEEEIISECEARGCAWPVACDGSAPGRTVPAPALCREVLLNFRLASAPVIARCPPGLLHPVVAHADRGSQVLSCSAQNWGDDLEATATESDVKLDSDSLDAMGELLRSSFIEAARKCETLKLPVKGTILYVQYMRPCRPEGTSLDVKASSFKSLRKFLEYLELEGMLSLRPGLSDPVVTDIHWNHFEINGQRTEMRTRQTTSLLDDNVSSFRPTWLRRRGISEDTLTESVSPSTAAGTDSQSSDSEFATPSSTKTNLIVDTYESPCSRLKHACQGVVKGMKAIPVDVDHIHPIRGNFVAMENWVSERAPGDEAVLNVKSGDCLTVKSVDNEGLAFAVSISGARGWLPVSVLRRRVYKSRASFGGGPNYLTLMKGDGLVVYHREGDWMYGAKFETSEVGWFPSSTLGF